MASLSAPPLELRWAWTLGNGGVVTAAIEKDEEIVAQGDTVLSRAPRGSKPQGHRVLVKPKQTPHRSERPPIEAVLTFGATSPICILRVDDHEVSPTTWPQRKRPSLVAERPPALPLSTWVLVLAAVLVVGGGGFLARSLLAKQKAATDDGLGGTFRALNGLFIAHYPKELDAKLPVLPPIASGVLIEDKQRTLSIVLVSVDLDVTNGARDPWALQQQLRDEALANLSTGAGRWRETARKEETCLGRDGAAVIGELAVNGTRTAKIWSCAFLDKSAGYLALAMGAEPAAQDALKRAREIVDATELTRLADLGAGLNPGLVAPTGSGSALPIGSNQGPTLDLKTLDPGH